ncbi:MAG TPA: aspartate-semialdehyde dehydrogenase [Candidatus Aminicenantes bacterium]|nr:aspartate-semialdehyde dehydrogenase [Candidatus Aminicenantes bacterium]HRY66048.1 aspartate-semialdehyde dehydrogenase [Candidatus Aminicenantes bacterium]HRZ72903.1 aspartate-semialdehyde dehydrogenase [Candidatus Aminicenantes bacterium]
MNEKNKIRAAVLGASGIVGQHFVRLLAGHPFFELSYLSSSARNLKRNFGEARLWAADGDAAGSADRLEFGPADAAALKDAGVRVVFSALPAEAAGPLESELRQAGLAVFTNSSAHRQDADVPIVVPEVNPDHLELVRVQAEKYAGFIVAGSNCSTAGLVLALKPAVPWGIDSVRVTTFQSISGAGRSGLGALDIAGNLIPYIKDEEDKIGREAPKILGALDHARIVPAGFKVRASCVRVPVREGHLLDVELELRNAPPAGSLVEAFGSFRGAHAGLGLPTAPSSPLLVAAAPDRPQPAYDLYGGSPARARGMAVTIGRPRLRDNFLRFFALTHNLVRGAAGNCLLAAELAFRLGYLAPGGKK